MTSLPSEDQKVGLEFTGEVHDPGLSVVMVARKKPWFSNKRFIFPLIIIALTAVGAGVSFVHDKSGEQLRPAAHKEHVDPPVKEESVKLAALERHDDTDTQEKRSHPDTSAFEKSNFPNFRNEAFKKAWLDLLD
jgi:hypothetical protein